MGTPLRRWLRAFALLPCVMTVDSPSQSGAKTLGRVVRGSPASVVMLDWRTGKVVAEVGATPAALPGSAIKPLLLDYALKHNLVHSTATVYCRRDLHVAGRAYPCTHPVDRSTFDAESALAESCNTWFAELGKRFPPQDLEAALQQAGFVHEPILHGRVEQRELITLGLDGVRTTPLEMAKAYRNVLVHDPAEVVLRGLRASVAYGMANNARVSRVDVLGKTGTSAMRGSATTQGWFAGGVPGRFVLVVYLPGANGAAAAALAARLIASQGPQS